MSAAGPSSNYRITGEVKDGVIRLIGSGVTTGRLYQDMNSLAHSMSETYATRLMLLDIRDLVVQTSFATIVGNITAYSRGRNFREWRTAILCIDDQFSQFDFIEMVTQVFGFTLKVFTDEALAVAWLKSEPAPA